MTWKRKADFLFNFLKRRNWFHESFSPSFFDLSNQKSSQKYTEVSKEIKYIKSRSTYRYQKYSGVKSEVKQNLDISKVHIGKSKEIKNKTILRYQKYLGVKSTQVSKVLRYQKYTYT